MLARLCGFLVWALVAASVVFWGLRLFVKGSDAPAQTLPVADALAARGDLTRLFGAAPVALAAAPTAEPALASRFRLYGVMAPKANAAAPASHGLALIAVDGKPARPYAVGAEVDTDLVVQSVSLRTAAIGPPRGAAALTLELAPPAPAATGVPGAGAGSAMLPTAPPPPPPPPVMPTTVASPLPPGVPAPGAFSMPASGGMGLRRGAATQ
ncbi:MAG: hypothetical protein ABIO45_10235 [Burkholderiaceae bacterium]